MAVEGSPSEPESPDGTMPAHAARRPASAQGRAGHEVSEKETAPPYAEEESAAQGPRRAPEVVVAGRRRGEAGEHRQAAAVRLQRPAGGRLESRPGQRPAQALQAPVKGRRVPVGRGGRGHAK